MGKRNKRRKKKYFFLDSNDEPSGKKGKNKNKKNKQSDTRKVSKNNYGSASTGSSNWNTAKKQPVINPDNVVRTDKGVYEFISSAAWGTILVPVEDPSNIKVTYDEVNGIKLNEGFPKIPASQWARWIKLCFYYCPDKPKKTYSYGGSYGGYGSYNSTTYKCWNAIEKRYEEYKWEGGKRVLVEPQPPKELQQANAHGDEHRSPLAKSEPVASSDKGRACHSGDLEVSCIFIRKKPNYDEWKILVPKQKVSAGSVDADLSDLCDIETGERYDGIPPGWAHAGSSHSHNTMGAFFSSTDDRSELTVPGLHIVIGSIDKVKSTYSYKASVVLRQLRKNVDLDEVVDATPDDGDQYDFHEEVLNMVTTKSYSISSTPSKSKATVSTPTKAESKADVRNKRSDIIRDEGDEDQIVCSPHYLAWKKRQLASGHLPKTIGDGAGSDRSVDDDAWTDGIDHPDSHLPLNEAFDEENNEWSIDRIIDRYERQMQSLPLHEDPDWHD